MDPGTASRAILLAFLLAAPRAAGGGEVDLHRGFATTVQPFLATYCLDCHGKDHPKGQLDLSAYASVDAVVAGQRQWETVLERLSTRDMPPQQAKKRPPDELREQVIDWLSALRRQEARRTAGDPGPVLARRLSNAEYDYTIRDLTGVDIRPTREFPVDPANQAGFDNSGESLAMSPALLKKYLEAARGVAEHVVLAPDGFRFAPHPVVTDTDRDRYCIQRIISFYERQPTDLAAYFHAAWRFRHRAALGSPRATLAAIAGEEKVSPKYLATVWSALAVTSEDVGPMVRLQAMWVDLPGPGDAAAVKAGCEAMRDYVVGLREKIAARFKNLRLKAVAPGAQPFVLWKNSQYATHRMSHDAAALYAPDEPEHQEEVVRRQRSARMMALLAAAFAPLAGGNAAGHAFAFPLARTSAALAAYAVFDPALAIPGGPAARERYQAAYARFARVFPDAFYVSERGRVHLDRPRETQDKGRLLSAGYHNMFGYFRDDQPLYQLILDQDGQRELDRLWRELDVITDAPRRQHADFIFYERAEPPRTIKDAEFDFIRSEDRASASEEMIQRLARAYLAKARESLRTDGGDAITIPVLEDFFKTVSANIQRVERDRLAAEPSHLPSLVSFAERAYRRPLAPGERASLLAFYRTLRKQDGLDHADAIRDAVASVLVSPHFLYRVDLAPVASGVRPLPDYALASRLSYFLWSSMPDAALLARAAAGELHRPQVLMAEVRRMLGDDRARALAVEFGGQWLDFRRFEEHNGVDRERFPAFDNDLRQAMFEEPVRFFLDLVRRDGSVLDFLYGKHTFVNGPLARHYGMPEPADWVRADDADRYGRGGILPMAVFLTKNAPGLRTSPVKRGYWVVRRALGEQIPPPPAQVPDLPNDEREMGNLTLREALARHRQDPSCAGCHTRFDALGLAFEGYGPIGELRTSDLGGRPVDTRVEFPGGSRGAGVDGLRTYLREHRQDDFLDNLCRKLLSYALGRTLIPSDDSAIEQMQARLAAEHHRFGSLVESVVGSAQFQNKRGRDDRPPEGKKYASH